MLVKMRSRGRDVLGLYVGKQNVRRHFPERHRDVELELDHLRIQCELKPSFWRDQPHISDPRLCAWLASKQVHRKSGAPPERLVLLRAGERSFRLQLDTPKSYKNSPALVRS